MLFDVESDIDESSDFPPIEFSDMCPLSLTGAKEQEGNYAP